MLQTNFNPFPLLETNRLKLRPLLLSDAEDIFLHRSDDIVNKHLSDFRHENIDKTIQFILRVQQEIIDQKTILWVLNIKGSNRFIGTVCFWNISQTEEKAETGYTLISEYHGLGLMNEAFEKIIDYGFNTMKLKTIDAYTHKNNDKSIRLLMRNHFIENPIHQKNAGADRIFFQRIS